MSTNQRNHGAAVALTGMFLIAFSARQAISGVSPLLTDMANELPFDAVALGVLGMIPTAGSALMGFLALPLVKQSKLEH